MEHESIATLLGKYKNEPMTETIRDNLVKVLGREVKIVPTVKNGYRNEGGKVFLQDIDQDEELQK